MNVNKNSMLSNLAEIHRLAVTLDDAVIRLDRASIVRICSCIQYCLSDLTELAIPDGYIIDVKPFNQ